jgi:DnaJ family protein C protein 3
MAKSLDKSFAQLDELLSKEDWRGVVKLLVGTGAGKLDDLWKRYEEALLDNVGQERDILPLVPSSLLEQVTPSPSSSKSKQTTFHLPLATKVSPQRQVLVKALCKSYTRLADVVKSSAEYKKQMEKWCEELLTLDGRKEDVDGLVGRAEALIAKQEFGEAVRVLEKAFEISGRGDRDVRILSFYFCMWMLILPLDSATLGQSSKLLKQSKSKDYYKVLGVARDADGIDHQESLVCSFHHLPVILFYLPFLLNSRKAAKHAHPDKGGSEAKMATLNEAYEVLSSPSSVHGLMQAMTRTTRCPSRVDTHSRVGSVVGIRLRRSSNKLGVRAASLVDKGDLSSSTLATKDGP